MPHRSRPARSPAALLVAAALVLAAPPRAAAAQPAATAAVPLVAPAPTGPHAVGRRQLVWVDSARPDPTDPTRPREIVAWVWYPAPRPDAGTPPRPAEPALPGPWGDERAVESARKIGDAAAEAMRTLRVHAATDAPWGGGGRAPVVLFAPGNGWLATDYAVLVEDLASHGWVVVGVASAGLADVVRFPDGRVVRKTLGVGPAIGADQAHAHGDVLHALDRLAALDSAPASPFRGRLDLRRVATLGHSLGGTTALVAADRDPRVGAAVNLDGDAMGAVVDVRPRQPLLFVSHELPTPDEAPPTLDSASRAQSAAGIVRSEARRTGEWARIAARSADAHRIRVLGLRHLNFTDAALASPLIAGPERRWMRWGPIDGGRGLRVVADLVRAFLDDALLGRPADAFLAAPERRHAELRRLPNAPPAAPAAVGAPPDR